MAENKEKKFYHIIKLMSYITWYGVSMITPLLLTVYFANYLMNNFGWGNWIVIIGVVFGVVCMAFNFYKMMKFFEKENKNK